LSLTASETFKHFRSLFSTQHSIGHDPHNPERGEHS
jgi:hypothetical protein